jgi:hypothetical protein
MLHLLYARQADRCLGLCLRDWQLDEESSSALLQAQELKVLQLDGKVHVTDGLSLPNLRWLWSTGTVLPSVLDLQVSREQQQVACCFSVYMSGVCSKGTFNMFTQSLRAWRR